MALFGLVNIEGIDWKFWLKVAIFGAILSFFLSLIPNSIVINLPPPLDSIFAFFKSTGQLIGIITALIGGIVFVATQFLAWLGLT